MTVTIKGINVYSEMNPFIDMIVVPVEQGAFGRAEEVVKGAYDEWFDIEHRPELQQTAIGDYISSELDKAGIEHELFAKVSESG